MANPRLSFEQAQDTVARIEEQLRAGHRPSSMAGAGQGAIGVAAAKAAVDGVVHARNTFVTRVRIAKDSYGLEPDWSLYRPIQYLTRPPGAPQVAFQDHIVEQEPEGEPLRMAVIGDAHDSPHLPDKSRFRWLGAYIEEHGFERVVSVGDWWTMDCFSTHTDRATFEGLSKPTFDQDRDSFHESQRAFQLGLAGHKSKLDCTLGNHEARAWKWDNLHPESTSHGHAVEEAFMQWGWRTTPYGQYRFFDGVGVVHTPLNAMAKPLAQGQRANKAMFDAIHGDDHRSMILTDYKTGPFRSPTVYDAGTALPPGYIEGFANKGGSTWRTGICKATIWGGYVREWSFCEMILLKRRYGRAGEGEPRSTVGWRAA